MANIVTFDIIKPIGVISVNEKNKWQLELNIVSWNGRPGKYDIRNWSPLHDRCGKGITMTDKEFDELNKILANQ